MKKILFSLLIALGLAVSARAVLVGFDIGYLTDSKKPYYAARVGTEFTKDDSIAHIGEVELGYTTDSEGGATASIMPVTVNYRAQIAGNGTFGGYLGAGAGMAESRFSGLGLSDSNWSFAWQAFAGISYKISDAAWFDLGARYIKVSDVKLFGVNFKVGDDTAIEGGFHFKF